MPRVVHEVLRSPGQPLDSTARALLEPRFGHDFSQVRVHTDDRAALSARAVDARAYTVGGHLVFGQGEYAPGTTRGRTLLSHELTHTIQQAATRPTAGEERGGASWRAGGRPTVFDASLELARPDTGAEQEAEAASRASKTVPNIRPLPGAGHVLQRQPASTPAGGTRPEDFGIALVVVDHGATGVRSAAQARLDEIYRHVQRANLAQLQSSGITRVEMHIIPYDRKIVDLPEFAILRGTRTHDGRLWDDVRGEGGMREGSTIRYVLGEEGLAGGRHGHGWAIGLGITLGAGLGAGGAALGVNVGNRIQGSSSGSGGIIGGIVGGVLGAGLGAVGGGLLGDAIDSDTGYAQNFAASHEGSHTVELFALTQPQRTRLQALYAARQAAGGPWLPPAGYTASTIHEYWAQCSAAYFSRPYTGGDASTYTPDWVRTNDPGMYQLLREVFGPPRVAAANRLDDSAERAAA